MIWWAIAVLAFCLAFSTENDHPTAPMAPPVTAEAPNHVNPGYQPCSKSTEGVKGRIRAVPVDPQEPC